MPHRGIRRIPQEAPFGGKPRAGLGDNNEEEEDAGEVEGSVTLDRTDNIDDANKARLNITFSGDVCNDDC